MQTLETQNINISILRSVKEAYEFISNPLNLPLWASGLSGSIKNINGEWIADSPMGKVRIKFADPNQFGILDHNVTLQSGETFYNPMRVISNQDGCEVIFTLFRQPNMTYEKFNEDAIWIHKDLVALKKVLEK